MDIYRCEDCGKKIGRDLWLDDKTHLCGGCAQTRRITNAQRNQRLEAMADREADERASECSLIHDFVDGLKGIGR